MKVRSRAFIALGANLPFRNLAGPALLQAALAALESRGVLIERISSVWTTLAWPNPDDPPFANAVAQVWPQSADPLALMALLLDVEQAFGRVRGAPNAPRTMDLDLLDMDGLILNHPNLILPHPRMADRRFVLGPLCDIAPDWRHPATGKTATALLAALSA